jgi:hypothetical protein
MATSDTLIKELPELLNAFYELNPVHHPLEGTIKIAHSLLSLGWLEHVTLNLRLERIVDGHDRVLAAKWLSEQEQSWFDSQTPQTIEPKDKTRYSPDYWLYVPCAIVDLDKSSHAAMTLGLNNEKVQGIDDQVKTQFVLNNIDEHGQWLAGHIHRNLEELLGQMPVASPVVDVSDDHYDEPTITEQPVLKRALNITLDKQQLKQWQAYGELHGLATDSEICLYGLKEALNS